VYVVEERGIYHFYQGGRLVKPAAEKKTYGNRGICRGIFLSTAFFHDGVVHGGTPLITVVRRKEGDLPQGEILTKPKIFCQERGNPRRFKKKESQVQWFGGMMSVAHRSKFFLGVS